MTGRPHYHDTAYQDFVSWVEDNSVLGARGADEISHRFLPFTRLQSYFSLRQLSKLLKVVFRDGDIPHLDRVRTNYSKVFCILLLVGKGEFIEQFMRHESLNDQRLPFDRRGPQNFPTDPNDPDFFPNFHSKQWILCAPEFHYNGIDERFEDNRILPIIKKERLAGGGSAEIYKIHLHEAYDHLEPPSKDRWDSRNNPHVYILKSYYSHKAEEYYKAEVGAFRKLTSFDDSPSNLIHFYGSYVQNGTYNIILEFADKGNLEDYFQTSQPPSSTEDIKSFYNELFNVLQPLCKIHRVPSSGSDGLHLLQGLHQDVNPKNILVKSDNSRSAYGYQFKLADLGLSHFNRTIESQEHIDSYGTRAYGAPECYRPDSFLQKAQLEISASVDIWSLGCVYSEAAVWVVDGWLGLQKYRQKRNNATSAIPDFKDGNCFHNGRFVLEVVEETHKSLRERLRSSDNITRKVYDDMIRDMLAESDRPNALDLWRTSQLILKGYKGKANADPHFLRNSRTLPLPQLPRTPPEQPPEVQQAQFGARSWPQNEGPSFENSSTSRRLTNNRRNTTIPPDETYNPTNVRRVSVNRRHSPMHLYLYKEISRPSLGDIASPEDDETLLDEIPVTEERESARFNTRPSRISESRSFPLAPGGPIRHSYNSERMPQTPTSPSNSLPGHNGNPSPSSKTNGRLYRNDDLNHINQKVNSYDRHHDQSAHHYTSSVPRSTLPEPLIQQASSLLPNLAVPNAKLLVKHRKSGNRNSHFEDSSLQSQLKKRDHVFLIDSSSSMEKHWPEVQEIFRILAYLVKECDPDGIELYFTTSTERHQSKKTTSLLRPIKSKVPKGFSDIKRGLNDILQAYQTKIQGAQKGFRRFISPSKPVRPLNLYIFTDGAWEDNTDVERPIKNLVEELENHRYRSDQVGIQFIRFGDNSESIQRLNRLDANLGLKLDIVDHEPSTGNVWKMLLGAINKKFDNDIAETLSSSSGSPHSMTQRGSNGFHAH